MVISIYVFSFWGKPPDPHQGSAPGPRWGTFVPSPPVLSPPKQISGYAPVKNSLLFRPT